MSGITTYSPLSQAFLQAILQQVSDLVLVMDSTGRIIYCSGGERLGHSDDELLGRNALDFVRPESLEEALDFFTDISTDFADPLEIQGLHANGSLTWYELSPARYASPGGELWIVVVARDIEERKKAEATIRESERSYRALVDQSPLGVLIVDQDFNVTLVNQAYADQVGAPNIEALSGHNILASPALNEHGVDVVAARVRSGETITTSISYMSLFGKQVDVRANVSPVITNDGETIGAQLLFEDVSESRRLEEQLRQSQKMEAVGRVAGGIAHDFNNNLTVILGLSDYLSESESLPTAERRAASDILDAAERSAALTRQLLAFSRPSLASLAPVHLGQVAHRLEPMLIRTLGETIHLTCEVAEDLPSINADPKLLEQVILNLALNARDAMPAGGELRLQASTNDDGQVILEVTDDGVGMDEPTRTRSIEPFFTTKNAGEGTGLGLSMVYGIVRQFGGTVDVESSPGKGSCFQLAFPAIDGTAAVSREAIEAQSEDRSGRARERILVLEDQRPVRRFLSSTLRREGYDVLEAENGGEALELARGAKPEIDLLLSDVRVPGMSGPEAVSELLVDRPNLRVLYISGYNDISPDAEGRLEGFELLPKPFSSNRLLDRVRFSLDREGSSA